MAAHKEYGNQTFPLEKAPLHFLFNRGDLILIRKFYMDTLALSNSIKGPILPMWMGKWLISLW